MELTEEMCQILVDGVRGTRVEWDDEQHGMCALTRTKLGYRLSIRDKPIIGPLQLGTESTQSLMEEIEP